MRISGGLLAAAVVCALHASATAQGYNTAPPPGGGGPPPPGTGAMTQFRWDAGLIMGLPQGDLDDVADTSFGLRVAIGYNVNPNLSAHASFRYILVSETAEADGLDISYRDFGVGGRYTLGSGQITPYVEGELLLSTIRFEFDGFAGSESDPAMLGRAGGIYKWKPNMDIIFFGSYTIIFVDEEESGLNDASWLELGGAIQGYF